MKFTDKGDVLNSSKQVDELYNSENYDIAFKKDGTLRTWGKSYQDEHSLNQMNTDQLGRWLAPQKQSYPLGTLKQLKEGRVIQPFRALQH